MILKPCTQTITTSLRRWHNKMDIGNLILALIILSPILAGPVLVLFMAIALFLKGLFTTSQTNNH